MKLRTARFLGNLFILLGILILIIGGIISGITPEITLAVLSILGLSVIILGYVFYILFWRCPFCHIPLPYAGSLTIQFCPHCGADLEL